MLAKFTFKQVLQVILSIIIGITFIFSALAKIPSLEKFGWTIVDTTFLNWTAAEWLARLLIGLELALGMAFILQLALKKITIPISIILLAVFSIYLLLIWHQYGNSGNCGCFGELLPMTPIESLAKNGLLLVLCFVLFKLEQTWILPKQNLILGVLCILSIVFPIWQSPPESIYILEKEPALHNPIPLSLLYTSTQNEAPKIELRKGKHIISFLSLTCGFCRKAAIRMRIMKSHEPNLPFYFVLNGDRSGLASFYEETKANNIEYTLFNGPEEFVKMNGSHAFPSIKWVEDTTVVRESNYLTLDENEISTWLK